MTKSFILIIIAAIFLSFACSKADVKTVTSVQQGATTPVVVSTIPNDGNYTSRGKVTKINMELVSVELDHEEIVGVMPPMIMEFYVREKSLLDGLKVGDNVDFVLEYKHPAETIVGITKIK